MNFTQFKQKVFALAKKKKAGHMIPNSDTLYVFWEKKMTPEDVVEKHCTVEAQKKRFGP